MDSFFVVGVVVVIRIVAASGLALVVEAVKFPMKVEAVTTGRGAGWLYF